LTNSIAGNHGQKKISKVLNSKYTYIMSLYVLKQ